MTSHPSLEISPELMLKGYAAGIFPMSESHKDPNFFWVNPKYRGIIPLNQYHIPRSLKKIIRRGIFKITFNNNKVDFLFSELLGSQYNVSFLISK